MNAIETARVQAGRCPHCDTRTVSLKHASLDIRFLQCSACLVVVALGVGD